MDRYSRYLLRRSYGRPDQSSDEGAGLGLHHFILFTLIVIAGTGGELCVSRAMKVVGEAPSLRPADVAIVILRALRVPWMWLGVGMMALAFFALLGALSIYNVSFVVPVTALSYVAGAFGGVVFLNEHVSFQRWLGVSLIAIGVVLVLLGKN
jgi:multidrug transporter EmrE-like cation transporter